MSDLMTAAYVDPVRSKMEIGAKKKQLYNNVEPTKTRSRFNSEGEGAFSVRGVRRRLEEGSVPSGREGLCCTELFCIVCVNLFCTVLHCLFIWTYVTM